MIPFLTDSSMPASPLAAGGGLSPAVAPGAGNTATPGEGGDFAGMLGAALLPLPGEGAAALVQAEPGAALAPVMAAFAPAHSGTPDGKALPLAGANLPLADTVRPAEQLVHRDSDPATPADPRQPPAVAAWLTREQSLGEPPRMAASVLTGLQTAAHWDGESLLDGETEEEFAPVSAPTALSESPPAAAPAPEPALPLALAEAPADAAVPAMPDDGSALPDFAPLAPPAPVAVAALGGSGDPGTALPAPAPVAALAVLPPAIPLAIAVANPAAAPAPLVRAVAVPMPAKVALLAAAPAAPNEASDPASAPALSASAAVPPAEAPSEAAVQPGPAPAPVPSALTALSAAPAATSTERVEASRPAPTPAGAQQEQSIAQVGELREAMRAARPEMTLRHAEFGFVSLRLEQAAPDQWRAVLAARDPGFVPAVQAALDSRTIAAAADSSAAQNGTSDQRYGASPNGGQGGHSPHLGHSGGRDGEAAPDHRRPSTAAALAARTEGEDEATASRNASPGGLFA